jgi:hypothetical protein
MGLTRLGALTTRSTSLTVRLILPSVRRLAWLSLSQRSCPAPDSTRRVEPAVDSFGPTFERVVGLLQRLDELNSAADDAVAKLKTMDSIVAAVARQIRVKYELKLEDVLPRCAANGSRNREREREREKASLTNAYVGSIMQFLGEHAGRDVRASAYRLLRHLIVDQHDVNQLHTRYFDLFLVRCVTLAHATLSRRIQPSG